MNNSKVFSFDGHQYTDRGRYVVAYPDGEPVCTVQKSLCGEYWIADAFGDEEAHAVVPENENENENDARLTAIESCISATYQLSKGATMAKSTTIHVAARRWFQKSYGNTYHSVTVTREDGEHTDSVRVPFEYGYGEQWAETAALAIEEAGWLPERERSPNNSRIPLRLWMEREGVNLSTDVEDVKRQKDL